MREASLSLTAFFRGSKSAGPGTHYDHPSRSSMSVVFQVSSTPTSAATLPADIFLTEIFTSLARRAQIATEG
jgi:hypothetical protein